MNDELKKEQDAFLERMEAKMHGIVDDAIKGVITKDDVTAQVNEALKAFESEFNVKAGAEVKELADQIKTLGENIAKMKSVGVTNEQLSKFSQRIDEMYESEKFKDFIEGHARKSGVFGGFSLKDITPDSMTNDYTGTHLITDQLGVIANKYAPKRLHMRDVLTALSGDPAFPNLAYTEIEMIDRNARYATENGRLSQSHIKVKEQNVSVKRLGTFLAVSKRMLKSRAYIKSYIVAMLPEAVYSAEDWNILFGDGNGENLEGIANKTGVKSVESIITESVVTGSAGSVRTVSALSLNASNQPNAGIVIEFTNPQPDILDGMKITFANAVVNTDLNGTHDVIKMNDRQILLPGLTLSGTETGVSSMTFSVNNGGFQSIDEPNSFDVIKTAFAVMTYAQYKPTAIVLNPITVNIIESEKDTLGRNLGLIQEVGGVKYIAGRPIIEYDGIPAGKYLIGDFSPVAASIVDYTNLLLEWAEDIESKLTNQVVLIAQEEIIFPIYNPWAFAYGDLATLKAAITKPTEYDIRVQPTATVGHTDGSDTVELNYTTKPLGATVTWTSSDSTKATVANGVVTGKSAGTAIITASVSDGTNTYTDVCVVTVS